MAARDSAAADSSEARSGSANERPERRITLSEWSTLRLPLDGDVARQLGETPRGQRPWLSVSTDPEPGWWKISARQWVGAFTLDDLRIIVRPKIKPENLFLLLEVGLGPEAWQAEGIDYATNDNLLSALVSFFARTAETTLARGLFHHYRHEQDDLAALRGRIDFVRQFRRGGVLVPMACSWDDFTADVDENRCLAAAIRVALCVPGVPHDDRRRLRRVLAALDGVAEPTAAAALDSLGRIERSGYTRLNEHYRPALALARLILANCTLQDRHGDTTASAFMVDMNELFERFVTTRLQRALRGRLDAVSQKRPHLDAECRVQLRPDLTLCHAGQAIGVADVKYKLVGPESSFGESDTAGRHSDYYQLLAYATALGLPEGTLIYCADVNKTVASVAAAAAGAAAVAEKRSPADSLAKSTITVRHAGTKLHAVAVDLSGSPRDIDAQIVALADHLEATTRAACSAHGRCRR